MAHVTEQEAARLYDCNCLITITDTEGETHWRKYQDKFEWSQIAAMFGDAWQDCTFEVQGVPAKCYFEAQVK